MRCWGNNEEGIVSPDGPRYIGDSVAEMGHDLPTSPFVAGRTVVKVAAGRESICALFDDGTVGCWGDNEQGALGRADISRLGDEQEHLTEEIAPIDFSPRRAVSLVAGAHHYCVLLDDGNVRCWGRGRLGQLGQDSGATLGDDEGEMEALTDVYLGEGRHATQVTAGSGHTCVLLDDHTVKCWGGNMYGVLGHPHGSPTGVSEGDMASLVPLDLGNAESNPVVEIAAGYDHACARMEDGAVTCWGGNRNGALGVGTRGDRGVREGEMGDALAEVDLGSGRRATSIVLGGHSSCAFLDDGTVKCWGRRIGGGESDGIGDRSREMGDDLPPLDVGGGRSIRDLVLGFAHACALLSDGEVVCWGENDAGQLGSGLAPEMRPGGIWELTPSPTPVALGGCGEVAPTPEEPAAAVEVEQTIPGCPAGEDCVQSDPCTPTQIIAGFHTSCAIWSDGAMKCWGDNSAGQLGLGDSNNRGDEAEERGDAVPDIDLGTGLEAVDVAVGGGHICAAFSNGRVKCWGNYHAIGLGGDGDVNSPEQLGDALPFVDLGEEAHVVAIEAGRGHTCVLLRGGDVKCWGANDHGQLGLGDREARGNGPDEMGDVLPAVDLGDGARAVEISVGETHSCARLSDGSVKCWGVNNQGQLGFGPRGHVGAAPDEMGDSLPAVDLGSGRRAVSIAAGRNSTCAVLDDDTVRCWGLLVGRPHHGFDRMGDQLEAYDFGNDAVPTQVFAGAAHACAIMEENEIRCWGNNPQGQLGHGDRTTRDGLHGAPPPTDLGPNAEVETMALSEHSSCAILTDGSIRCWGSSRAGQGGRGDRLTLGDEADEMGESLAAADLGPGREAVAISASRETYCAVFDDGGVRCWGENDDGLIGGFGDTIGNSRAEMGTQLPLTPTGGRIVRQAAIGSDSLCAVFADGTVGCWGGNAEGQLARAGVRREFGSEPQDTADRLVPLRFEYRRVESIVAGISHYCALLDDGNVRCWGSGIALGQDDDSDIGDDPGEIAALPDINLGEGRRATQLAAGHSFSCALLDDGTVKCWGANRSGQLGQGSRESIGVEAGDMAALSAIDLGDFGPVTEIAAGTRHVCARNADGAVICWGANEGRQLGTETAGAVGGAPDEMGNALTEVVFDAERHAVRLALGPVVSCAILDDGSASCWGEVPGAARARPRGRPPASLAFGEDQTVLQLSVGQAHACAVLSDGTTRCWGSHDRGQLGLGLAPETADDETWRLSPELPPVELAYCASP